MSQGIYQQFWALNHTGNWLRIVIMLVRLQFYYLGSVGTSIEINTQKENEFCLCCRGLQWTIFGPKNQSPWDINNKVFFNKDLCGWVLSNSKLVQISKCRFGSLLKWYNSVKAIPERFLYKGFTYAIKKVNSSLCGPQV